MVKLMAGEVRAVDLLSIAMNPVARTAISKFGPSPVRYIGRAVSWKGKSMENLPANVRAGLQKAIGMSKAQAGVRGVSVVKTAAGGVTLIPTKCGMQMEEARTGEIVQNFRSAAEAMSVYGSSIRVAA